MKPSDAVRAHCAKVYIEPARAKGSIVEIRAGDVHKALGYKSRIPLVCGAIGAEKFSDELGIQRVALEGPLQGTNTIFFFKFKE